MSSEHPKTDPETLFLADFFYKKKYYVGIENFPGFYALYGFFMCVGLVLGARSLRIFLKRDEDYYAPYDIESEAYPEDQMERDDLREKDDV